MSDDEGPVCQFCGVSYLEMRSEGAPCGVDECYEFTCCDKAWAEHCKLVHPVYYAKKEVKTNG